VVREKKNLQNLRHENLEGRDLSEEKGRRCEDNINMDTENRTFRDTALLQLPHDEHGGPYERRNYFQCHIKLGENF
jgi:hypothetical protein